MNAYWHGWFLFPAGLEDRTPGERRFFAAFVRLSASDGRADVFSRHLDAILPRGRLEVRDVTRKCLTRLTLPEVAAIQRSS